MFGNVSGTDPPAKSRTPDSGCINSPPATDAATSAPSGTIMDDVLQSLLGIQKISDIIIKVGPLLLGTNLILQNIECYLHAEV